MNEKETGTGLAARLLHGARDLIWQDDALVKRPGLAPVTTLKAVPCSEPANRLETNGMAADLLALVMNRPTAYSSLSEAIAALSDIAMDEGTRYRSAFAVLKKTQQRTVEQIAQAIDVHLSVLESEQLRFSSQSKTAEDAEITSRISELAALNTAIAKANTQIDSLRADTELRIAQLQDDIATKQARALALTRETEEKRQAIARTTQGFEAAFKLVQGRLADEKSRVRHYLA